MRFHKFPGETFILQDTSKRNVNIFGADSDKKKMFLFFFHERLFIQISMILRVEVTIENLEFGKQKGEGSIERDNNSNSNLIRVALYSFGDARLIYFSRVHF